MEMIDNAATLASIKADIATGLMLIENQVDRLNVVIGAGGAACAERIVLWDLESNQARLNVAQSDTLNSIARARTSIVVLVVDDEPIVLMSAVDCLTSAGFAVLEAGNADEAIELLESDPGISAIFTDVQMRGSMDGIALARLVHARWPAIKVIVTSGNQSYGAGDLAPEDQFVRKPYRAADIVRALRAN